MNEIHAVFWRVPHFDENRNALFIAVQNNCGAYGQIEFNARGIDRTNDVEVASS
jgi:hypothetical protein